MARLHTNVLKWGNKHDGPDTYKHGRRGALDDAFWDEDELVDFPRKARKVTPKKKPGCPGNDGGPHVYVWTSEFISRDLFFNYFGFHKYEDKRCCGCNKRSSGYRRTERYNNKFKGASKWGSPENDIEGYREYRRKWLVQRGYTPEYYGIWF